MTNRCLVWIVTSAAALLAVLSLTPVTTDGQVQPDEKAKANTPVKPRADVSPRLPYDVRGAPFPRQLTVYDRQGNVLRTVGEPGRYSEPVLSPDGTRLAVVKFIEETSAVWVFDLSTGAGTQVTPFLSPGWSARSPVWSSDGSQIAYFSNRENYGGLYRRAGNGTGLEEQLYRSQLDVGPLTDCLVGPLTDWSPDERFLSFNGGDILCVMPVNGDRKALELAREEFSFFGARFSPDSRFLAYVSDESGRNEVYVRPFDPASGFSAGGGKWQVSNQGGLGLVQWRRDGRELYYLAADGGMMAVDVIITPAFEAGPPRLLFRAPGTFRFVRTNAPTCGCDGDVCEQGSISRDGRRIVFAVPTPPERREVTVASEVLVKYTGTYTLPDQGIDVVVALEDKQLMIQITGREKLPLFAESETYFFYKVTNGDFEFVKDDKGVVTQMNGYFGGPAKKYTRK